MRQGWIGSLELQMQTTQDAKYTGWINNKVLVSRGNDIQYPVISHNGK